MKTGRGDDTPVDITTLIMTLRGKRVILEWLRAFDRAGWDKRNE